MAAGYEDATFYSRLSRGIGVAVAVIGAIGVFAAFFNKGWASGAIVVGIWVVLAVGLYLVMWRPRLDVRDDEVVVVNPFRTHVVPWSSIDAVEIRWVLTMITNSGSVPVWAVPRPSSATNVVGFRRDPYGMPDFNAERRHQQQDGNARSSNAAITVIEARLNAR